MFNVLIAKDKNYNTINDDINHLLIKHKCNIKEITQYHEFLDPTLNFQPDIMICIADEGEKILNQFLSKKLIENFTNAHFIFIYTDKNNIAHLSDYDNIILISNSDRNSIFSIISYVIKITRDRLETRSLQFENEFLDNTDIGIWCFKRNQPIPIDTPTDKLIELFNEAHLIKCNQALNKYLNIPDHKAKSYLFGDIISKFSNPEYIIAKLIENKFQIHNLTLELNENKNKRYYSTSIFFIIKKDLLIEAWGTLQDITETINKNIELNEIHNKNNAFFKALPDIVFYLKSDSTIIDVRVNDLSKLRQKPEDIINHKISELELDPELLNNLEICLNKTLQEKEIQMLEYSIQISNKTTYHEARFVPIGKHYAICIIRDMTSKKKSEKALQETERKLSTLISNIPGMVYRCRFDKDWTMTYISDGCLELTGYSSNKLLFNSYLSYSDLIHPEDKKRVWEEIYQASKELGSFIINYRIITKAGEIKWVWEQGQILFNNKHIPQTVEGVISDITNLIEVTDQLKKSEENYRLTIDALTEIVHVIDLDYNILLHNSTCQQWIKNLGLIDSFNRKNIFNTFPFLDKVKITSEYEKIIKTKKPIVTRESNNINGTEIVTMTRKIPIIENDSVTKILTVIRDETESKRNEMIQHTIYDISSAINSTKNLKDLMQRIRNLLGKISNTDNFYIALYDEEMDKFHLPYEIDEADSHTEITASKSLTAYVYNANKAMLLKEKDINKLRDNGEIEFIGTPSKSWLGVPLFMGTKSLGVMVVQSYDDLDLYSENDVKIFEFTSYEIARAIVIKQSQDQINTSLREKEVMLQEIHHRVKNNLQIISSLLHMQSKNISDSFALNLLKESQNRVRSMAMIHQKLYEDDDLSKVDFNNYVKSLVQHLVSSYHIDQSKLKLIFNIDDIALSLKTAIPCGLILNEIISNALKYAFPDENPGEIKISVKSVKERSYQITIADNGVGLPDDNTRRSGSLGMKLIDIFVEQIKGSVEVVSKKGVCYNIIFTDSYLH